MQSFLSSIKTCIIGCSWATAVFIGGCGDNPQRAVDRNAQAAVEAALKEYASSGDFSKAQKALTGALSEGAGQEEIVLLADGSLKYGRAVQMQEELAPLWKGIEQNLDELSKISGQIARMQLEKAEVESALRSRQEERKQLMAMIDGDGNRPGLNAQLKDSQTKLSGLKSQRGQLEQTYNEKLKQTTELQRQADELLAQAELVKGDKKAELQKQAYGILLGSEGTPGKNAYLTEAQGLLDQLTAIDSEIALIGPKVAMFTAQIETNRSRVDELDKSDFATKSNERLTAIGSALTRFQEEFAGILGQIEQTQTQSASKVKQITDLLLTAQKDFKKITLDESLREFARVAGAEASVSQARVRSDYAISQRQLAARLSILVSVESTDSQAQLKTLAQRYLDDSNEYAAKALTDYNDALNLYDKIPARKLDEFSIAVLKNNILAVAQKAYLAEQVENMTAKADAMKQGKDLIAKAVKLDPTFESSLKEPPYNILTGEGAAEAPAEANEVKAAAPEAAAEANQPVAEPSQPTAEPNQAAVPAAKEATVPAEANEVKAAVPEAAAESNQPAAEPNEPIAEPNQAAAPAAQEVTIPAETNEAKVTAPEAAVESNQPAAEPNEPIVEPNQAIIEPNQSSGQQSLLEAKAVQLITLMSEGNFAAATLLFDDNMKQAMPAAKLEQAWKQLETVGGSFKSIGQSRNETIQGFEVVVVPTTWEKNKLDFKVVFDKQGSIAGLTTEAPK